MIAARHSTVTAVLLVLSFVEGCRDGSPPTNDTGTTDASVLADSGLDTGVPDAGTQYDFCDQPLFKLPIDGWTEETRGVDLWGQKIAYVTNPVGDYDSSFVYLFDIDACTRNPLTWQAASSSPSIFDGIVLWTDSRNFVPERDRNGLDIYMFDVEMWQEFRLTEDSRSEGGALTNGTAVVINRNVSLDPESDIELILLDLEDGSETIVAPEYRYVAYYDMGERYVVYSGYATEPGSVGRDIYYYDLETGITNRVMFSRDHYTYFVKTSGSYLTYVATQQYTTPPFFLVLYNMETGEHRVIEDESYAIPVGHIHRNLVVWPTTKYSGSLNVPPSDVEMYDINTDLHRRLTTQSGTLWPGELFFPYFVIGNNLGISTTQGDVYVANLVELGVTDAQGSLIPGDPVLEPVQ